MTQLCERAPRAVGRGDRVGLFLVGMALLSLGACDRIRRDPPPLPDATAPVAAPDEIEAPEVFTATDQGLWDGRPSLGGTWVAYPGVDRPERVLIRNDETGRTTRGALFRREREMDGPAFQVSSDAAEGLGMLAGAPASLTVIALRPGDTTSGGGAELPAEDEAAAQEP
ncbi:hypothetical protein [Palleronia aestuarii]|uniref:hypothetical protein n=1 Tax=Palleronia aestuarii TaxID=568105 RepID=UPI0011B74E85